MKIRRWVWWSFGVELALTMLGGPRVHGSDECVSLLTTDCQSKKTACVRDCFGKTLQNLEFVEFQDSPHRNSPFANQVIGPQALGLVLEYKSKSKPFVIDSVPEYTEWLSIANVPLSSNSKLEFPSAPTLQHIFLSGESISSIDGLKMNGSIVTLSITNTNIKRLANVHFPSQLRQLDLSGNQLDTITNLQFPDTLRWLSLNRNEPLTRVANVVFPWSLRLLEFQDNPQLEEFTNVTFPSRLIQPLNIAFFATPLHRLTLTSLQWQAFQRVALTILAQIPTTAQPCTRGYLFTANVTDSTLPPPQDDGKESEPVFESTESFRDGFTSFVVCVLDEDDP